MLSEAQRVKAIESSGHPGGDGSAVFCDVDSGALKDIAQNDNQDTDVTGAPGILVSNHPILLTQINSISIILAQAC